MISEYGIKNFKIGSKTNEISQHPYDKVKDWIDKMGEKVFEWMDK